MDIEQVLDVPVLREIDHDFKLSSVLTWLALALAHETPEVQVLPQARVDSLHDAQEQVIVVVVALALLFLEGLWNRWWFP